MHCNPPPPTFPAWYGGVGGGGAWNAGNFNEKHLQHMMIHIAISRERERESVYGGLSQIFKNIETFNNKL